MIRNAVVAVFVLSTLSTAVSAAEMNVPVGSFDRIALGGSPEVTVTTGRAVGVHASGDQRELDRLDIRVGGGTLKIGNKNNSSWNWGWGNRGRVRIAVTVPMVRGVVIGGSGSVAVDRVKSAAFDAVVGGSGSIAVAALDTGTASFTIGGSGHVDATGRCDSASVKVGGSGSLNLGGLKCATLTASIAGSGGLDANASRSATVSVAGSGDVRIAGGAKCSVSKHGSGSVTCGDTSVG